MFLRIQAIFALRSATVFRVRRGAGLSANASTAFYIVRSRRTALAWVINFSSVIAFVFLLIAFSRVRDDTAIITRISFYVFNTGK
jgi:hypothetical protein